MFSQVYCAIVTQLDSENVIKKRNMAVTLVGSRLELLFFFFFKSALQDKHLAVKKAAKPVTIFCCLRCTEPGVAIKSQAVQTSADYSESYHKEMKMLEKSRKCVLLVEADAQRGYAS